MPHARIKINATPEEAMAWGKLVKSWATGRNYVDHPITDTNPRPTQPDVSGKYARPTTFYDFVKQCDMAKVTLRYEDTNLPVDPKDPLGLVMLQTDSDVAIVRLSPTSILDASEVALINNSGYPTPDFYKYTFKDSSFQAGVVDTVTQRMEFHARRVGEYTIAMCF